MQLTTAADDDRVLHHAEARGGWSVVQTGALAPTPGAPGCGLCSLLRVYTCGLWAGAHSTPVRS
ncbi:hypothetical protein BV20DRAFT_965081 [Pilatotrama ljubarskyi]|nr:hypothetical protein BV20DRAFT_965081 [Pilatotrama ljubarskyi]